MPFYRSQMGMFHLKGTKLPAPCAASVLIDGAEQTCAVFSLYLCDGPTAQSRKACDAPLCEAHARQTGRNRHLCPACHLQHCQADAQRGLFTSIV